MTSVMKFFFYIATIIGLLYLSGCDNTREINKTDPHENTALPMEHEAKIITNNPDIDALRESFDTTIEKITEKTEQNDAESIYLLGLINFGHITGFEREPNRARAIELIRKAWRLGIVDAGYSLFTVYYNGVVAPANKPLALAYLEASAEKGLIISQRDLGHAYRGADPQGLVEEDIEQARYWFTRAAEQGDAESATQLAGIYHKGLGVERDDEAAFNWLKRAENMPFEGRMSHSGLAMCYEQGIGTEVDLVQAYKYYDLQDPAGAPDKRRLEAMMTPEQVQEAIRLSRERQEERGVFVPSYYGLEYQPDGSFK